MTIPVTGFPYVIPCGGLLGIETGHGD